jgi:hypothetical protein
MDDNVTLLDATFLRHEIGQFVRLVIQLFPGDGPS